MEHFERDGVTPWSGVRSFQARNNMTEMKLKDQGLFYHSSIAEPAAVAICEVAREAYPDFTAQDKSSEYFDRKSSPSNPLWYMVDVKLIRKLPRPVKLAEMRNEPRLTGMALLRRGQRLSVQPVMPHEWKIILEMAQV